MWGTSHGVLDHLRTYRRQALHVIDPYKVPVDEAVEKAVAVQRLGHPAIIVASTDYKYFESHMPGYLTALKRVVDIPLILHFPPRKGIGFPLVTEADAAMFPALLGSEDDYFVWKSYLDTVATLPQRGLTPERCPEPLLSAALTFGTDDITYNLLGTIPIDGEPGRLEFLASVIRLLRFDMVYLYSRFSSVAPETCRYLRERLLPEQLVFVAGGIRTRNQIEEYHRAGADFVAFAGALEHPDWRTTLAQMCPETSRRVQPV